MSDSPNKFDFKRHLVAYSKVDKRNNQTSFSLVLELVKIKKLFKSIAITQLLICGYY